MLKKLQTLLESLLNRGRSLQNDEVAFHCSFCHHSKKKLQVKLHIIDGGHGLRSMPTIGSIIKEYIN